MSTANEALQRNAVAQASTAPAETHDNQSQPARTPRRFNIQQELLAKEFAQAYNISPDQISFDSETGAPFFYFEALAQIVTALTNFSELRAHQVEINHAHGHVTSEASITLPDGRVVSSFGSSFLNEELPNGKTVSDFLTALDVSRARALRSALRMVGFDPVRAHEAAKQGGAAHTPQITAEEEQRNKELAEIHIIAEEAGLIVGDDKSAYLRQLSVFFPFADSAAQLNSKERAQFIALLRSIKSARGRSEPVSK